MCNYKYKCYKVFICYDITCLQIGLKKNNLIQLRKYSYIKTFLKCDLKHSDHMNFLFKLKGKSQ